MYARGPFGNPTPLTPEQYASVAADVKRLNEARVKSDRDYDNANRASQQSAGFGPFASSAQSSSYNPFVSAQPQQAQSPYTGDWERGRAAAVAAYASRVPVDPRTNWLDRKPVGIFGVSDARKQAYAQEQDKTRVLNASAAYVQFIPSQNYGDLNMSDANHPYHYVYNANGNTGPGYYRVETQAEAQEAEQKAAEKRQASLDRKADDAAKKARQVAAADRKAAEQKAADKKQQASAERKAADKKQQASAERKAADGRRTAPPPPPAPAPAPAQAHPPDAADRIIELMNEYDTAIKKNKNNQYIDGVGPRGLNTCYKILEVGPDASREEIKQSYRRLIMAVHPQKYGGPQVKANSATKSLNAAYKQLEDSVLRQMYNKSGIIGEPDPADAAEQKEGDKVAKHAAAKAKQAAEDQAAHVDAQKKKDPNAGGRRSKRVHSKRRNKTRKSDVKK